MIETLTPQLVGIALLLIALVAPVITLVFSLFLLWRYRVAVRRAMDASVGFDAGGDAAMVPAAAAHGTGEVPQHLASRARRGGMHLLLRYALAGLALAAVLSTAAQQVFPLGLGVPGWLVGTWLYLWPLALSAPMIVRWPVWRWVAWYVGYGLILLAFGALAGQVANVPEYHVGAMDLGARSSVTPLTLLRMWLTVNLMPTVLIGVCLNRRVRAVAPLMLALSAVALAGWILAYFLFYSPFGQHWATVLGIDWPVLVLGAVLLTPILGIALCVRALLHMAARYRRGRASDQMIQLDALWLVFLVSDGLWLVLGGLEWALVMGGAWLAFKGTWWLSGRLLPPPAGPGAGLTFLRVFALGARTEGLLHALAQEWRHVGSIQLITGLDLADRVVHPHQFLDFLGLRLRRHFVHDAGSMSEALAAAKRTPDPDGRYRINNFFCHADSWQAVLPHLVAEGDRVVMDLRSFTRERNGCAHELGYLVRQVPLSRVVLVDDSTTDLAYLDELFEQLMADVATDSPNHGARPDAIEPLVWPGRGGVDLLLDRLDAMSRARGKKGDGAVGVSAAPL